MFARHHQEAEAAERYAILHLRAAEIEAGQIGRRRVQRIATEPGDQLGRQGLIVLVQSFERVDVTGQHERRALEKPNIGQRRDERAVAADAHAVKRQRPPNGTMRDKP